MDLSLNDLSSNNLNSILPIFVQTLRFGNWICFIYSEIGKFPTYMVNQKALLPLSVL